MNRDPKAEQERDDFEYDPPRSIFAATWFRALLVLIVVGVAGAIAVLQSADKNGINAGAGNHAQMAPLRNGASQAPIHPTPQHPCRPG